MDVYTGYFRVGSNARPARLLTPFTAFSSVLSGVYGWKH